MQETLCGSFFVVYMKISITTLLHVRLGVQNVNKLLMQVRKWLFFVIGAKHGP